MSWRTSSWLRAGIATAVTLAVLFGGQSVFHRFAVARPLDAAFGRIAGVESFAVQEVPAGNGKDKIAIEVTLRGVDALERTYREIVTAADRAFGRGTAVTLRDGRSPELAELEYRLHYTIQEAISTGRFGLMAETVGREAAAGHAHVRIAVDSAAVYLQLKKDGAELYSVYPRAYAPVEVK